MYCCCVPIADILATLHGQQVFGLIRRSCMSTVMQEQFIFIMEVN